MGGTAKEQLPKDRKKDGPGREVAKKTKGSQGGWLLILRHKAAHVENSGINIEGRRLVQRVQ